MASLHKLRQNSSLQSCSRTSSVLLGEHGCKSWQVLIHCCVGLWREFLAQVTGQGDEHTVWEQLQGEQQLFLPARCDFEQDLNGFFQICCSEHLLQTTGNKLFNVANEKQLRGWSMLYRYLKVAGVNSQSVSVQGLQGLQTGGQLADVLGSFCYGQDDLSSVGQQVGGGRADVNVGEVGLAAWVGGEHSVGRQESWVILWESNNQMLCTRDFPTGTCRAVASWSMKVASGFPSWSLYLKLKTSCRRLLFCMDTVRLSLIFTACWICIDDSEELCQYMQ